MPLSWASSLLSLTGLSADMIQLSEPNSLGTVLPKQGNAIVSLPLACQTLGVAWSRGEQTSCPLRHHHGIMALCVVLPGCAYMAQEQVTRVLGVSTDRTAEGAGITSIGARSRDFCPKHPIIPGIGDQEWV